MYSYSCSDQYYIIQLNLKIKMVGEGDSVRFHERKCDTFLRGNFAFLINWLKWAKTVIKGRLHKNTTFLNDGGQFFFQQWK